MSKVGQVPHAQRLLVRVYGTIQYLSLYLEVDGKNKGGAVFFLGSLEFLIIAISHAILKKIPCVSINEKMQ